MTLQQFLAQMQSHPQQAAAAISGEQLGKVLQEASDLYYNTGESVMSDDLFDDLKELLQAKDPTHHFLAQIGAPVTRQRVQLPFGLYSLDKVKPDSKDLVKWQMKFPGPYCLSDKLDGTSCLIVYKRYRQDWKVDLMTRGDGVIGGDITHLVKYLVPAKLQRKPPVEFTGDTLAIRGEIIISKKNFADYGGDVSNARSLTNGLVNRKTVDEKVARKTDFVVYEVVSPRQSKVAQMRFLTDSGLLVVDHQFYDSISDAALSQRLDDRRRLSPYEIDGLVVEGNGPYDHKSVGNPVFAFAFKKPASEHGTKVKVIGVTWQASKDGLLKPRVQYEPIKLDGVVMQFATGHNAKYILDNNIGPGAVVEVIRSGMVIPTIVRVVKPAKAQMPTGTYTWTKSGVDAIVSDLDTNDGVQMRRLIKFFSEMGIDNISKGLVNRFWEHDFHTLDDYLTASVADLKQLPGIEMQMATKLHGNIQRGIKEASLVKVMKASNAFSGGVGERKLTAVLNQIPNLLSLSGSKQFKMQTLVGIEGIQETTAEQILSGVERFKQFMKDHPQITLKLDQPTASATSQELSGMHVVFSGIRDKDLSAKVEAMGGVVNSSVSSKTTILVVKDTTASTGKIEKAKEMGIKVMNIHDFAHHIED